MFKSVAFFLAIGLAGIYVLSPALAQDRQYVGPTQQTFDGGQGLFAPHRACWDDFEAVWCTSQMIIENGPHPFAGDFPPDGTAWVNPVPVGLTFAPDVGVGIGLIPQEFSVDVLASRRRDLNCSNWIVDDSALKGMVLAWANDHYVMVVAPCGTPRPAACCAASTKRNSGDLSKREPPR